jgi:Flp pilus assembly protein TadG
MRRSTTRSRERLAQDDGAVIVEFAAIFIVFAMLLWGLISYGVIFAAQQSLTHAAAEAARSTVGMSNVTEAEDRAEEMLQEELTWLADGLDVVNAEVDECENNSARDCMHVTVTYDWGNNPIVPSILDVATPDTLTGRAVVQFR